LKELDPPQIMDPGGSGCTADHDPGALDPPQIMTRGTRVHPEIMDPGGSACTGDHDPGDTGQG